MIFDMFWWSWTCRATRSLCVFGVFYILATGWVSFRFQSVLFLLRSSDRSVGTAKDALFFSSLYVLGPLCSRYCRRCLEHTGAALPMGLRDWLKSGGCVGEDGWWVMMMMMMMMMAMAMTMTMTMTMTTMMKMMMMMMKKKKKGNQEGELLMIWWWSIILPYLTISYNILPRVCSSIGWRRQHRFSPEFFLNESFSLQMLQLLDEKNHDPQQVICSKRQRRNGMMCPPKLQKYLDPICTTEDPYCHIFSLGMGTKTEKTPI